MAKARRESSIKVARIKTMKSGPVCNIDRIAMARRHVKPAAARGGSI